MTQSIAPKTILNALHTREESVRTLSDHQPFQFANPHSHEPTMIVNDVVGLAKAAKRLISRSRASRRTTPLLWVIREELKQAR